MKQLLICILYISLLFKPAFSVCQQSNPFEIVNRPQSVTIPKSETKISDSLVVVPPIKITGEAANNNADTSVNSVPPISEQEQKPEINNSIAAEPISYLDQVQKKLMDENPFNITHIPLRRATKEIKKEVAKEVDESKKAVQPSQDTTILENDIAVSTKREMKSESTNKFIFWLLLLQLLLVTSLLSINREFLSKLYRSINNDNFAKLVGRDYNNGYDGLFGILYLLFILSLSVFAYLSLKYFYNINGIAIYGGILLSIIAIYAFRHFFMGFTTSIFPFGKASTYYNFMIILFNSFLGLILIPVNVILAYSPASIAIPSIYIGLTFIFVLYLLRFLRGSLHAYTYIRNYLFHFFLYLCTCEFAPVFILVKFLSKSFTT